MQLIGIVETRYFGGPHELAVRILKDDGETYFDLPVSLEQASELLANTGDVRPRSSRPQKRQTGREGAAPTPPAPPAGFEDDDDEVDEIADTDAIRLARFPGSADQDDAL